MELKETQAFVKGCIHDEPASCSCACPFSLDVRSFLKKMSRGRFSAAYRELSEAILFPSIAAELCDRPCRKNCQRVCTDDEPIDIGALERACISFASDEKSAKYPIPPKEESVAIVGAGAAGLACALPLARKKYKVTVFEKKEVWGGCLATSRKADIYNRDFEKQFSTQNVDFRFGVKADEKLLEGFDAVYIAAGDKNEDFGLLPSWDDKLFTTSRPGWFMGGNMCDMDMMESIAAGNMLSQLIEAYLKSGRASLIVENAAKDCPGHFVKHDDAPSAPITVPADGIAYTKDEAKAEASRCMQCICSVCMDGCEMMASYKKTPYKLSAEICGDSNTTPPFTNCEATRQTYSCNMCSWCKDNCPEGVDMGALFRFSREDRWKQNKWVPGLYDFWLRELDFNIFEGFYASKGEHEFMFFPGCQLTGSMPKHVTDAYEFLREKEDCGIVLGCCGAPAVWAGDLDRQSSVRERLTSVWNGMGKPTVITACSTCADMLKGVLPDAEIISLYEKLDELGAPASKISFKNAAIFDPCSARRDDKTRRAVRALAERSGCETHDLRDVKCCGYGGHIKLANPDLFKKIADNRASESLEPYIVYCANCREVFLSRGKTCVHILDAVFGASGDSVPTLDEKRNNALSVKKEMCRMEDNTEFVPEKHVWDDLVLTFSADAQANMEDKLIAASDIRETVWRAENGDGYFEDGTGVRTACFERGPLTFWADYRTSGDGFEVMSAYCHRMHIGEEKSCE